MALVDDCGLIWKCDELGGATVAQDLTANNRDGVLQGGSAFINVAGLQCVSAIADIDYVLGPDVPADGAAFTLFWQHYLNSPPVGNVYVLEKYSTIGAGRQWRIRLSGGALIAAQSSTDGTGNALDEIADLFAVGAWQVFALVFDGSVPEWRLYQDGNATPVATVAATYSSIADTTTVMTAGIPIIAEDLNLREIGVLNRIATVQEIADAAVGDWVGAPVVRTAQIVLIDVNGAIRANETGIAWAWRDTGGGGVVTDQGVGATTDANGLLVVEIPNSVAATGSIAIQNPAWQSILIPITVTT